MGKYNLEIAKLLIYNPKKSRSCLYCYAHYSLKKNDSIIMIVEIKPNTQENKKIIELIFESFKKHYQTPFLEDNNNFNNLELHFESALQKTNQEIQIELIRQNKKEWLEKCGLVIGVAKGKFAHFTYLNNRTEVFLVRDNRISSISEASASEKINPFKIFTNISSGILKSNDRLLICNSALLDFFSREKLKKIALSYPPELACQHIRSLIAQELDPKISISAVMAKVSFAEQEKEPELSPLIEKTEIQETIPLALENTEIIEDRTTAFKKSFWEKINLSFRALGKIKQMLFSLFRNIFSLGKIKEKIIEAKNKFKFLSRYHKIIILSCVFLLLLFIQSIAFLGGKRLAEKQKIEENNAKQKIVEKQQEVEVLLNYQNKEKAESALTEIEKMISALPSKNERQLAMAEELKNKNQELLNKTRDIYLVKPNLLIDFSSLQENFSPQKFLLSEKFFYSFDLKNASLFQSDITSKNTVYEKIKTENYFQSIALLNKENILLVDAKGNLLKYNLKEKTSAPYNIKSDREKEIGDAIIYQDKLYLLDLKSNQILKYQNAQNEFSQEANWLKENADLKGAVSFAIDGDIYVAKLSGQIIKLFKGKKQDFNLDLKFDKQNAAEASKPIKIITETETKYLYLLDALNERVVIIDKINKKVFKQLKNEEISKAQDFIVLEKEGKIYLLTDRKILEINL